METGSGVGSWRTVAMVVSVVGATVATFADWARSGQRSRSSYELIDVIGRAEILDGAGASAIRLVYGVPLLAGIFLLAISLARPRLAGIAAATVGATVLAAAVGVELSPLRSVGGLWFAVVAGAGALVTGSASAIRPHTTRR